MTSKTETTIQNWTNLSNIKILKMMHTCIHEVTKLKDKQATYTIGNYYIYKTFLQLTLMKMNI